MSSTVKRILKTRLVSNVYHSALPYQWESGHHDTDKHIKALQTDTAKPPGQASALGWPMPPSPPSFRKRKYRPFSRKERQQYGLKMSGLERMNKELDRLLEIAFQRDGE